MGEAVSGRARDADREHGDVAGWLRLAATPGFALMALLTATHGGNPADVICAVAHHASLLDGMTPMYAAMSALHAAPWVRLLAGRRAHEPAVAPRR